MARTWRVAIVKDTAQPCLGYHGLHVAFRGLPGVEVVALVDSNRAGLEAKLEQTRARRHYFTLGEMLAAEAPDIAVLCSRHPYEHFEQIQAVAEAGCHMYCEKPLSASLLEADRIVALLEDKDVKLCMAHPARQAAAYRTMRALIGAGEIGMPVTIYGRGKNDRRGGGEDMVVLGTHILDLEAAFFGAPAYVLADVTTRGRPIVQTDRTETVEPIGPAAGDEVFAYFRFPGGVRGIFESRRGLAAAGQNVHMGITVIGTAGALSLRFNDICAPETGLRISRRPGPPEDGTDYVGVPVADDRVIPGAEPLDYSLCGQPDVPLAPFFIEAGRFAAWDLMQAIEQGRRPACSAYDARLALEMIYGIYASALSRSAVPFPLHERAHPLGEAEG